MPPPPPLLPPEGAAPKPGAEGKCPGRGVASVLPQTVHVAFSPQLPGPAPSVSSPAPVGEPPGAQELFSVPLEGKMPKSGASKLTTAKYNLGSSNSQANPMPGTRGHTPPGNRLSLFPVPCPQPSLPLSAASVTKERQLPPTMEQG